jgi:hypothetical protein
MARILGTSIIFLTLIVFISLASSIFVSGSHKLLEGRSSIPYNPNGLNFKKGHFCKSDNQCFSNNCNNNICI